MDIGPVSCCISQFYIEQSDTCNLFSAMVAYKELGKSCTMKLDFYREIILM